MVVTLARLTVRLASAIVLFLAASTGLIAQDSTTELGIEEHAEARLITARVRLLPKPGAEAGACLEIDERDLDVKLRGARVGVESVELDRQAGRSLHALLIDTSGSMANSLDYVRDAALGYVDQLHAEQDRALIVTFDDSVLLHQGVTDERELLAEAVRRIRPGMSTALNDGLYYVAEEMSAYRERPVIILLSDGHDTSSLHDRGDVQDLLDRRPDLTVFTIGFNLHPIATAGPSGVNSIRRFLHRLAHRTNGKYFDVPTGSGLDDVYLRIREMLDSEAVVRVVDPDPSGEPGKLKISIGTPGCKIQVFRDRAPGEEPLAYPLPRPWPDPPATIELPPDPRYLRTPTFRAYYSADPECAADGAPPSRRMNGTWQAVLQDDAIRGCVFDVTMDVGPLFDLASMSIPDPWWAWNAYLKSRTRRFEVLVPEIDRLPEDPVDFARQLAEQAAAVADAEIERDSRKKPFDRHARPYHDLSGVVHGRTFFDLRERLAVALFSYPDYRQWALDHLAREAETDLQDLRERYRRQVPDASDAAIELAVEQSEEGRAIRERASNPSPLDLARHLAGWLGDLPAIDLFEHWEARWIENLVDDPPTAAEREAFAERWDALYDLLFVPSYARELTLLRPAVDRRLDRIGFYRVVLPRPSWFYRRVRNDQGHPGWSDLPFDLFPDEPLAFEAFAGLTDDVPQLASHLRRRNYRVTQVDYRSYAKPRKQSPVGALRRVRVSVAFAAIDSSLRVEFDLEHDPDSSSETTLTDLRFSVRGDADLRALTSGVRDRATVASVAGERR